MGMPLQAVVNALAARAGVPFSLVAPDGSRHASSGGRPRFTLVFRSRAALRAAVRRGHMGLLESYFDGELELDGHLGTAFAAAMASGLDRHPGWLLRLENSLHEWRHAADSSSRAGANANAHYGLGEPFYRQFLDHPLKMYTCAYWSEGVTTLEQAQVSKIDHICKKILLEPGERFIDLGCGFGGFMFRASEVHGARGTGVNATPAQAQWVRDEITRRGLQDRLSVQETDLREADGGYDKMVSIGVLEHAGRDQLGQAIRAHAQVLRPGGLGMLQFIGHLGRHETDVFIRKHIFPGGWIPSLADVLIEMERCGLEALDIENLRRHYALTLDEWASRFERHWEHIRALDPQRFDERFRRIWRCYFVGCAEMFRSPSQITHLFQITFSKGNVGRSYPMTRAHLYRP